MSKIFFLFILIMLLPFQIKSQEVTTADSIRRALNYQRINYPVSQYRDVYKNFMQDFYGPGHMINDKRVACDNLQKEMTAVETYDGPDFEATGYKGNFYRVNLRLIAFNVIPYQTFLDAFVKSVQSIVPPDSEVWKETWLNIDNQIKELGWNFENEEQDRKYLKEQFDNNNFVVHHSDAYNQAVNFHYRIISKEIFENIILPYLK